MEQILSDLENLLEDRDLITRLRQDGQTHYAGMLEDAAQKFHKLQTIVADRERLTESVARLKDLGGTMWELKVSNTANQISNAHHLTKILMSHRECKQLLELMDVQELWLRGDTVSYTHLTLPTIYSV